MKTKITLAAFLTTIFFAANSLAATPPILCPSASVIQTAQFAQQGETNAFWDFTLDGKTVLVSGVYSESAAQNLIQGVTQPNTPNAQQISMGGQTAYYCTYAPYRTGINVFDLKPHVILLWLSVSNTNDKLE